MAADILPEGVAVEGAVAELLAPLIRAEALGGALSADAAAEVLRDHFEDLHLGLEALLGGVHLQEALLDGHAHFQVARHQVGEVRGGVGKGTSRTHSFDMPATRRAYSRNISCTRGPASVEPARSAGSISTRAVM